MFNTILVPTDGSELAEKAIHAATEFARENKSRIIGLAVGEPYPYSPLTEQAFLPDQAPYEREVQVQTDADVQKIAAAADRAGVPFQTFTVLSGDPATEIISAANKHGCDVVFMASHGRRGIDRLLLGSVTQKVLLRSTVPVLVFR